MFIVLSPSYFERNISRKSQYREEYRPTLCKNKLLGIFLNAYTILYQQSEGSGLKKCIK